MQSDWKRDYVLFERGMIGASLCNRLYRTREAICGGMVSIQPIWKKLLFLESQERNVKSRHVRWRLHRSFLFPAVSRLRCRREAVSLVNFDNARLVERTTSRANLNIGSRRLIISSWFYWFRDNGTPLFCI